MLKKDFSSSRNSSRLSPVQLLRYWTSANELERVVGWSIRVDEDEARDLATARLPHGSFNNSRVGGGRQLGATDIDLTQTTEWQPNLSEEALWMKNCIKYKTMQRNNERLRKLRCNMEFRTVSVHMFTLTWGYPLQWLGSHLFQIPGLWDFSISQASEPNVSFVSAHHHQRKICTWFIYAS